MEDALIEYYLAHHPSIAGLLAVELKGSTKESRKDFATKIL